jgi:hypothetical protein
MYVSLEDRFLSKVDKNGPEFEGVPCWLWIIGTNRSGRNGEYGRFWLAGRNVPAHHVAWELLVGPIPDGLEVDHLCRRPSCVNPAHMEWVTHRENMLRGRTIAAYHASKTLCDHGHPFDEANTYVRPDGRGRQCRACMPGAKEKVPSI